MAIVKPKVFWPITITTANRSFVINGAGTAQIATGVYSTPVALATALALALNNLSPGFSVSFSTTGIVVISAAFPFQMIGSGSTAAPLVGLYQVDTNAVFNGSSAYELIGSFQHANSWYPPVPPREDSLPIRDRAMNVVTRAVSGQTKFVLEEEVANRVLVFSWLPASYVFKTYELLSSELNQAVERWFESGYAQARYWPNREVEGTYLDYVLDLDTIRKFAPKRQFTNKALYEVTLSLWGYVS